MINMMVPLAYLQRMDSAPRNGALFLVFEKETFLATPCFRLLKECDQDGNCADGGNWILINGCCEDGGEGIAHLYVPDGEDSIKNWHWCHMPKMRFL